MMPHDTARPRLHRAFAFVWRAAPGWAAASLAIVLVQGILPLLSLYLMKLVVNAVAAGLTAPDPSAAFRRFALLVLLAGAVALASSVCGALSKIVSAAQSQSVSEYMHEVLHAKSTAVDLEYYEDPRYHDRLHRAQREAPFRPTRIVTEVMQVIQAGISLLGIAGLLLSLQAWIGAVLLAVALPGILVRLRHSGRLYSWEKSQTPAERRAWYFGWLLTHESYAKEIRLFHLGPVLLDRFREISRQLRGERLGMTVRGSLGELAAESVALAAVFGLFGLIGYQTLHGRLTLGDLVMYFQAVQRGQALLTQMLASLAALYESNLFLSSLFEFLDLQPAVLEPALPRPVPRPVRAGLRFEAVSFQYPGSSRKVLDGIELVIRPGEHVAFVGENGAGKTTLIKLLCRLYDPTSGAITLDGIDLRQFETAALRREMSVVFQDYVRYQLSARDNIWFGSVGRPPDPERIAAAARQAGAHEVIARLKDGYETTLGKWFEGGTELSVGEWQKIALARAFLREGQIIVLDEPSSAMDAQAEYELFRKFDELAAGRTALLISHRLSTVRMADRIYVLEQGRIVESGTHEELISRGDRYARLFETQARYYR
jgi:ATP-binding cassette subfamily B protein